MAEIAEVGWTWKEKGGEGEFRHHQNYHNYVCIANHGIIEIQGREKWQRALEYKFLQILNTYSHNQDIDLTCASIAMTIKHQSAF